MQISTFAQNNLNVYYMQTLQNQLNTDQTQISSGRAYNSVSQNPQSATQELILNESQSQLQQYQGAINQASGYLGSADSIYGSIINVLQDTSNRAIQASGGGLTASDYAAIGQQISQDIQQVVTLTNSRYAGEYMFSGSLVNTAPVAYNGTSVTYNGDTVQNGYQISPTLRLNINPTANTTIMPVLNDMINLRNQVLSGNVTNIQTALSTFKTDMNAVINERSSIGAQEQMLTSMKSLYTQINQNFQVEKSKLVDANVTKLMSNYNAVATVYQATLDATVKSQQLTILKYM